MINVFKEEVVNIKKQIINKNEQFILCDKKQTIKTEKCAQK